MKHSKLASLLLFASPFVWLLAAPAQDLVAVAPQAAKVEYQDPRVRVVRLTIAPGETLPMHDRPGRVVIPLTPGEAKLTRPDGSTSISRTPVGKVGWGGPTKRTVVNVGDGPIENIVVELQHAEAPANPLEHPPDPLPAEFLRSPFHHWLFENQYVRVYDVRIPPGATTDFHRHALTEISVRLSGSKIARQVQGQAWSQPEDVPAKSVEVNRYDQNPKTHRVRNDGAAEYHVVVVELLK